MARTARKLEGLRRDAADCHACDLWRNATQTVFGEGDAPRRSMLVGEQPGDREDLEGHPFVGRRAALLDEALEGAGIDRDDVYVTNAVKHFKWKARGKRRIHDKPTLDGGRGVPPVARRRARGRRAARCSCRSARLRRRRCSAAPSASPSSAASARGPARAVRRGDRASLVDPAGARRRRTARGLAELIAILAVVAALVSEGPHG